MFRVNKHVPIYIYIYILVISFYDDLSTCTDWDSQNPEIQVQQLLLLTHRHQQYFFNVKQKAKIKNQKVKSKQQAAKNKKQKGKQK